MKKRDRESEIKKKKQIEKKNKTKQKEKFLRCKVKCTYESMKCVTSGFNPF